MICFLESLRGSEGFMIDAAGLRKGGTPISCGNTSDAWVQGVNWD